MVAANAPPLRTNEVHIWTAALNPAPPELATLERTLSVDERMKVARLRDREGQKRYVAARSILRDILASYLDIPASQVRFSYGEYGKPELEGQSGSEKLRFNLSHSHDVALIAITRNREIGVDLEEIRPDLADDDTARFFFSWHEIACWRSIADSAKTLAFFNCWTRKEAYLKATGRGFAAGCGNSFDVSVTSDQPAAVLRIEDDANIAAEWSLHSFAPAPDYVGAVAVKGVDLAFQSYRWTEPKSTRVRKAPLSTRSCRAILHPSRIK